MAKLNGKEVIKVVVSPIQEEGATEENQTVIVITEKESNGVSNQTVLNGGLLMLENEAVIAKNKIDDTQKTLDNLKNVLSEINGLIDFLNENTK